MHSARMRGATRQDRRHRASSGGRAGGVTPEVSLCPQLGIESTLCQSMTLRATSPEDPVVLGRSLNLSEP